MDLVSECIIKIFNCGIFLVWNNNKERFMWWLMTVIKRPQVKKMLRIPDLPPPPPGQQPSFDLFSALKKMKAMTQDHTQNQTLPPSPVNPRISSTSLSPVSKRLKALESQVKGRKKNSSKKRWSKMVHTIFVRRPRKN